MRLTRVRGVPLPSEALSVGDKAASGLTPEQCPQSRRVAGVPNAELASPASQKRGRS